VGQNDALFKTIFDDSPDAIFLMHPHDFQIVDCNAKALQLFEVNDKNELTGRDSFSLYESEPVEFSKNIFIENISNGQEHSQEMAFKSLKGNIFWGKCSIKQVETAHGPVVVFRVRRVVDYMKTAEMLSTIIKRTAKSTGYEYFSVLTELLSKSFGVCTVMIARVDIKSMMATTMQCWYKSKPLDNLSFNLETSPALNVTHGYPTFYPSNLKEMFPDDKIISDLGLVGFLGTPVYCSSEEVCGLLLLMDDKPMEEIPNSRYILSIFASRAGAEFDRIQVEENYQRKIRELEHKNEKK
jgi:PAS domain S-box-containing protein